MSFCSVGLIESSIICNKIDFSFRKKLQDYPLRVCFDQYTGPNKYGPAIEFIEERFKAHFQSSTPITSDRSRSVASHDDITTISGKIPSVSSKATPASAQPWRRPSSLDLEEDPKKGYVSWSCSPPAAEFTLALACQF